MKLRNKKTGEIVCARFCGISYIDDDDHLLRIWLRDENNEYEYKSLAELNAEWEDVLEEPKSNIGDLPAFPPENLTKNKAEELLTEIEKAKNPLATYLKNKGGEE